MRRRRRGEQPGQKIETVLLRRVVSGERRSVYRHGRLRRADASGRLPPSICSRSSWRSGGLLGGVGQETTSPVLPPATHSSALPGRGASLKKTCHHLSHPPSANICICRGPHLIRTPQQEPHRDNAREELGLCFIYRRPVGFISHLGCCATPGPAAPPHPQERVPAG